MLAIIRNAKKESIPRYDAQRKCDVATLMVVVDVDYVDVEGNLVHSQRYAHLPEDVDPNYYARQAAAMEVDAAHAKVLVERAAQLAEQHAVADRMVDNLRSMTLGDHVEIKEGFDA